MQRGQVFLKHGAWFVRFYRDEIENGQPVRRRVYERLARYCDEYRSKRDVLPLVDKVLAPVNSGEAQPESSLTLSDFVTTRFFPSREKKLHASTISGYREMFSNHLQHRIGHIKLRDFRTVDAQHFLDELAERTPPLSHETLKHVKSFLSGVFTFARQEDVLRGVNPVQGTKAEGRRYKPDRCAYSLEDIRWMLTKLKEPARTVIATAAFSGLRKSEIRGLGWNDYSRSELRVQRSVWRTVVDETKTESSEDVVPVIPILKRALDRHREQNPGDGYIFTGDRGRVPLNLDNLAGRVLIPTLKERWRGWHGFRRGLASNLYLLGVPDKVIQQILRHSDVSTTQRSYIVIDRRETKTAMKKFERAVGYKWATTKRTSRHKSL